MKIVAEILSPKIADPSFGTDVTLEHLQRSGKQVLIFRNKLDTTQDLCWDRNRCIHSKWHNQPSWKSLEKELNAQIALKEKFLITQAIITANSGSQGFFSQILSLIPSTLSSAETVNKRVICWQRENITRKHILMVDKVESLAGQISSLFHQLNQQDRVQLE